MIDVEYAGYSLRRRASPIFEEFQVISLAQTTGRRLPAILLTLMFAQSVMAQLGFTLRAPPLPANHTQLRIEVPTFPPGGLRTSEINISNNPFPQNEPFVKISRKDNRRVVAAWRDFRTGIFPAIRRVAYSYSTDGGETWAQSSLLPQFDSLHSRATDPSVTVDADGNFYVATISLDERNLDGRVLVFRSTDGARSFDTAFVASSISEGGEDRGYIGCDISDNSPYRNTLYVCWTRINPSGGILLAKSTDRGVTWSNPVRVSEDTSRHVGGATLAAGGGGQLYVAWVGRYGVWFTQSGDAGSNMANEICISGIVESGTGWPSIAADLSFGQRRGSIYVVWEDARNGDSDVFLVRSLDTGISWSSPQRVNTDQIRNGRDQFLPSIAVDDSGFVYVLFYDTSELPDRTFVQPALAVSKDGGNTFVNWAVSSVSFQPSTPNSAVRFGDYISIDSWGGRTVAVWMDQRAGGWNQEIYGTDLGPGTDSTSGKRIAPGFSLLQNHPNPFSTRTVFQLTLPEKSSVSLKIFNILGQEIETLLNAELPAGVHSLEWYPTTLPGGVYPYRFRAQSFVSTKKALLVK